MLLKRSFVSRDQTSSIKIGKNVKIRKSHISARNNSTIIIQDNVEISSYNIVVLNGTLEIWEKTRMEVGNNSIQPELVINSGKCIIENNNIIKARIWIRFNGVLKIGKYNAINENTEIRSDERVTIGDFNMISYECMIYDTNTHCSYTPAQRRSMSISDFPIIGKEFEKPPTKPIIIGNDCWLGKRAVILKGSILKDNVIIGTNSVVSNKTIETGKKTVGNPCVIL